MQRPASKAVSSKATLDSGLCIGQCHAAKLRFSLTIFKRLFKDLAPSVCYARERIPLSRKWQHERCRKLLLKVWNMPNNSAPYSYNKYSSLLPINRFNSAAQLSVMVLKEAPERNWRCS